MECGKTKCKLEVHHIKPRRLNDSNTVGIFLPCVKNAMRKQKGKKDFQSSTKHCKKVDAKKCRMLWKYNKIYWLESAS